MNVVHLKETRDMLQAVDAMRARILRGVTKGFAVAEVDWEGGESVIFAGLYRDNKEDACKAAMRMSWAMEQHASQDRQGGRM